jgi:hypothetical protein
MLIKQITQFVKKRDYEIVLIINPLLLHIAKQIFPSQYTLLPTLAQEEYQKMLAISSALFAPLGINTYYESSYYNIPTFILPEQHLGHIKSIQRYFPSLKSIKKQSFCLIHPFPELLKCLEVSEKEYIIYLEEKITQLKESFLEISHISEFLQNGKNLFTKYHYDKQISQHIEKIITHILS